MDHGSEYRRHTTEFNDKANNRQGTVSTGASLSSSFHPICQMLLSLLLIFALPVYSLVVAALRAKDGDPSTLVFAAPACTLLAALFLAVREVEKTPRDETTRRRRLVAVVWGLSVLLQLWFTRRVAELVPPLAAVGAWWATAVFLVGFWLCFRGRDGSFHALGM